MKRQTGLKKAQLLLQVAKNSIGSRQALDAYKFHLEQLLEEYDLAVFNSKELKSKLPMY